jgi:hypothetical protein
MTSNPLVFSRVSLRELQEPKLRRNKTCRSDAFCKKRATRLLEKRIQAPVTPSERHYERSQKVPGRPGVVGAALEPSGFFRSVSQRELRELECVFPKVELHASCKRGQR